VIAFVSHSFTMRRLLFANRPRWTLMQRRNGTPQPRNADVRRITSSISYLWPLLEEIVRKRGHPEILQCHFVMVTTAAIE
jgi:hypothetical protein